MNRLDELENAIKNAEESITNLRNELEELKKNSESAIPENVEDIPKKYDFDDYTKLSDCWHKAWFVNNEGKLIQVSVDKEGIKSTKSNMVFPTREFAEMFREKAQLIADCLLFKWMYDRDYVPVWDGRNNNWGVVYDRREDHYNFNCYTNLRHNTVYFSNKEIAEKCAEWLNYRREKRMKEE